ncbi:EAL domain-containing protein [bacterium]|nr:MAG: EAL domain-containing protein [bacterium]
MRPGSGALVRCGDAAGAARGMDGRTIERAIRRLLALLYDEPTVLREACELLTQYRGYAAVAITYLLPEGELELVAAAGPGAALAPHALQTGVRDRSVVVRAGEPAFEPWREAALRLGIVAAASLPLYVAERLAGALTAYAAAEHAFGADELELLTEMAQAVGRAVEAVRMRLLLAESAVYSNSPLRRMETLWRLSSAADADVEHQAETILAEGARTLGFDAAAVERAQGDGVTVLWAAPHDADPNPEFRTVATVPIPCSAGAYVLRFRASAGALRQDAGDCGMYGALLAGLCGRLLERLEAQRARLALIATDPVAGLANRDRFMQTLEHAVLDPRLRAEGMSVMLVDVDRFDDLRLAYGDEEQERTLRTFADRIRGIVGGHAHVAYLARAEFAVAVSGPPERGEQLARVLGEAIALPFVAGGSETRCTASIGVALFPADGSSPEGLLEAAGAALVRAQHEGGALVRFFNEEAGSALRLRRAMLQGLRFAVQRDEFELHYQPTIDLAQRRVTTVEALLRWRDPRYGLRLPADFIETAEESEAVLPIDEWVMREAAHRSQVLVSGARRLRLSFNVSGSAVAHAGTLPLLAAVLRDEGADPSTLELELSERVAARDVAAARRLVDGAHDLGLRVALDDFGAGNASLGIVKRLPVDSIKIDSVFVRELPHSAVDAAIVRAAITLAKSLDRRVVAEGVESEEAAQWLAAEGCEAAQGYWFSPPLPQKEFLSWLSMHG